MRACRANADRLAIFDGRAGAEVASSIHSADDIDEV
jgi:hypothetical protein